jgi:hypothetical protein
MQVVCAQDHTQSGSLLRPRRLRRKEFPVVLDIDEFTSGNNPRYALVRFVANEDLQYAALGYWAPRPTRADLPHDALRVRLARCVVQQFEDDLGLR